jgi:hypothetical protein
MNHIHRECSRFVAFGSLLGALYVAVAVAQAQTCPSFPIALSASMLGSVPTNTLIADIINGDQPGNFGWLSWSGDQGEATLVVSLTAPGESTNNYVNPDDPTDHELNVGDWVVGLSGVSNRSSLRNALNNLLGVDIIVPVFDQSRDTGGTLAYHVMGFAQVQLVGYYLPSQNTISVLFLGFTDCSGGSGGSGGPGV